jgi:hypothetical protein
MWVVTELINFDPNKNVNLFMIRLLLTANTLALEV